MLARMRALLSAHPVEAFGDALCWIAEQIIEAFRCITTASLQPCQTAIPSRPPVAIATPVAIRPGCGLSRLRPLAE